jgi:signal transduction histidine kinase
MRVITSNAPEGAFLLPTLAPPAGRFALTLAGRVTLLMGVAALIALLAQAGAGVDGARRSIIAVCIVVGVLLGLDHHLAARFAESPPRHVAFSALALHTLLVEIVTLLDGLNYTAILYLALPFPAYFWVGRRAGLGISGLTFGWITLKFLLFKPGGLADPSALNTYVLLVIALILIVVMAGVVARERANRHRAEHLLGELQTSHAHLARYAAQVAELATTEERNRLARDIHDSLGHHLTVIGVQLEKALLLADDQPEATLAAVRAAKRLSDQALADVRQSVGALRAEPAPFSLTESLAAMVSNLHGLALKIELRVEGDENLYARGQRLALYRAAQEGLTNIQRHAHATRAWLTVCFTGSAAALTLEDDGIGLAEGVLDGAGFGLRGVRERLETANGRLEIGPREGGGTRLTAHISRWADQEGR